MKKKIAMFLLSGTLLGALPLNVSAAATGMQDESIGDLTYEVPEGWIVSSETSDGQITCTSPIILLLLRLYSLHWICLPMIKAYKKCFFLQ